MKHIAVDIGNSRLKIGYDGKVFTQPADFTEPEKCTWWIASVCRPALEKFLEWVREFRPGDEIRVLDYRMLPISVDVQFPEKVGIDRLLAAVAANRRRPAGRSAVVVDFGTAITVDLIGEAGNFCGGTIFPGMDIAAEALHTFTDALPKVDVLPLPDNVWPIGKNTHDAILGGVFWGTVGAVRELTKKLALLARSRQQIFLTGGAAEVVLRGLRSMKEDDAKYIYVPEMVLEGIREVVRRETEVS